MVQFASQSSRKDNRQSGMPASARGRRGPHKASITVQPANVKRSNHDVLADTAIRVFETAIKADKEQKRKFLLSLKQRRPLRLYATIVDSLKKFMLLALPLAGRICAEIKNKERAAWHIIAKLKEHFAPQLRTV